MNWTLFFISLSLLQLGCLAAGLFLARGMKNNSDYFLASREVSFFPLMMTLVATQVGGGLVLGAAEEASRYGWSVLLYPLGQSLGFLLLAAGIGKRMAVSGATTVAELLEMAFGSRSLRQVASLLSMISLFMIFVAQVIASKKFMVSLGPHMGLDSGLAFSFFWGVVILYTVFGGLKGVIAIDLIQAAFFAGVFVLALFAAYPLVPENLIPFSPGFSQSVQFGEEASGKVIGWLLMPLLFMAIEQDMGQRCFAADSPKTVTLATFGAAILTFSLGVIPIFFGVLYSTLGLSKEEGGSVFMSVIQKVTNPEVSALMAVAILAVLMSTAISLINAISSNLTQDFKWEKKEGAHAIGIARVLTAVIAVSGLFFSQFFDNIVDLLIQSYDLALSALFVPVMIALFNKRGSKLAAWASFFAGMGAFFLFRFIPVEAPREVLSLLISGLAYLVTAKFFKI